MAVDRFYAIDRAADFPAATRGFHLSGIHFSWMPLRLALVPPAVRRARAHRAALEQFAVRHVTHTHNRCGILIFVSMAEHYARVIALISQIRDGQIAAGFVAAIERCGAVLAAKAPPDGSADELPDRLYVM
jgi:putative membrane protein